MQVNSTYNELCEYHNNVYENMTCWHFQVKHVRILFWWCLHLDARAFVAYTDKVIRTSLRSECQCKMIVFTKTITKAIRAWTYRILRVDADIFFHNYERVKN